MDKLPNLRRLLYLICCAVNSDDDAHALAELAPEIRTAC